MQKILRQLWSFSRFIFDLEHVMVESTIMKTYKCIWGDRRVDIQQGIHVL